MVYGAFIPYHPEVCHACHDGVSRCGPGVFLPARKEDKRRDTGPVTTETAKGGVTVTDIEIHKTENRLQQVGFQRCIVL